MMIRIYQLRKARLSLQLGWVLCGLLSFAISVGIVSAQATEAPEAAATSGEEATTERSVLALEDPEEASQRTELNLLGEVDASSGEGRRNENVSLTLIDNNVLKELKPNNLHSLLLRIHALMMASTARS